MMRLGAHLLNGRSAVTGMLEILMPTVHLHIPRTWREVLFQKNIQRANKKIKKYGMVSKHMYKRCKNTLWSQGNGICRDSKKNHRSDLDQNLYRIPKLVGRRYKELKNGYECTKRN